MKGNFLKPLTRDEWHRMADQLAVFQEENWKKHFQQHPEQLLPGAEVCRSVKCVELDLSAKLIALCPQYHDEG